MSDERLTRWQLGDLLQQFGNMMKEMPRAVMQEVEYTEQEAVGAIAKRIKESMDTLARVREDIDAQTEAFVTADDARYKKIRDARDVLAKRVAALPKLPDVCANVYGVKELLDIADRSKGFTDEQWKRVIDLAKALRPTGQPPV